MSRLKAFFIRLVWALGRGVRRYPVTLALCAAATALALVQLHGNFDQSVEESLSCWMMALALAVFTALCVRTAAETFTPPRWTQALLFAAAAGLTALYRAYLTQFDAMASAVRLMALCGALILLFLALPFVRRRDGRPVEILTIRLAYRALITGVYAGVLMGGVSAILAAVDKLLGVKLPDHIYEDVALLIGGLFTPAFFLAGVPDPGDPLPAARYPAFVRVLLLYVLIPLLAAYGLILYIYFVKMLATLSWPVGMLGNMVFWYILIGAGVLFLLWPLRDENPWARTYCRWFPPVGLLPLVMMFISMGIRIAAYGVTENRYFVWIMGMWLLAALIVRTVHRRGNSLWMPLTLAVVAFLAVMGPWNAFSVSRWSQNARLTALLEKNGMLLSGRMVPAAGEVGAEDRRQISGILAYFDTNHDLSMIPALPEGFELNGAREALGFEYQGYYEPSDVNGGGYRSVCREERNSALIEISGYDYYVSNLKEPIDTEGTVSALYDGETGLLTVSVGSEQPLAVDMKTWAGDLFVRYPEAETVPGDEMTFTAENDAIRVRILVDSLEMREGTVSWVSFSALIGIK